VIGLLIPIFLGWSLWRLMERFPTWQRLQLTVITATFLTAIIFTPVGAEGPAFTPLGIILAEMCFGVGGEDLRNHVLQDTPVPFLCVWGGLYLVLMIVVGIFYFIQKLVRPRSH
jgi:uncharacterized membrane protein YeiH